MAKLQLSKTVNAPIQKTFQMFADFPNAAKINGIEKVEMLTNGPIGVGTRFKETRIMFGKEATEEMEVTQFEPNRLYTVAADSCGARFETLFQFEPQGDKTHVKMTMNTQAVSLFAKLMSPLTFMMTGMMKKCIQSDIDQLTEICEQAD